MSNGVAANGAGHKRRLHIHHWAWLLMAAWSGAVLVSLGWNIHQVDHHLLEQAQNELRASFFQDLALRQWATRHGGIYVPVTAKTQPDPRIAFLPERDVATPSGRRLTLLNPATVLREYYDLIQREYGTHRHLSSLRPLNPANQADPWEAEALRHFTSGAEEHSGVVDMDGRPHLRLIRPMIMGADCLTCHAQQGYHEGDIGGAISMAVPLSKAHAHEELATLLSGHGVLWLLGLAGITLGARLLTHRVKEHEQTFQTLEEQEERIRTILASSLDAIVTIDSDGIITGWNTRAEMIFGWPATEAIGLRLAETIIPQRYRDEHQRGMQRYIHDGNGQWLGKHVEIRALRRDGSEIPVEITVAAITVDGRPAFSAFVRDISPRKQAEAKIQRDYHSQMVISAVLGTSLQPLPFEERLERILDQILSTPWLTLQAKGMIFTADRQRQLLQLAAQRGVPEATVQMCSQVPFGECHCGRTAVSREIVYSQCLDHQHERLVPGTESHGHYCLPIISNGQLLGVLNLYLEEGHQHVEEETQFLAAVCHALGGMMQRHHAEERLRHNAYHDALTQLPNRSLFMDRLERCIKRTQRNGGYRFAVLFLDLDRFKNINDSLGHSRGDQLLVAVAQRLENCLRPADSVARLGGDEFVILLDEITDGADATRIAQRVHEELAHPFQLDGHEVYTSISIGIALYQPDSALQPEEMLRDADTAMYRAKAQGNGQTIVFDTTMHFRALALLTLETELRRAVERDELLLYYQPIFGLEENRLHGFEALIRWQHPERGMVPPSEFIPVAEESGIIDELGLWVLDTACAQMSRWQHQHPDIYVSVNLSAKQLRHPELPAHVRSRLQQAALNPAQIRLEITETLLLDEQQAIEAILQQLRADGIQLYLDDFGTGYSSLSYLHNYPFDAVKIDRAFISKLGNGEEHAAMVQAIVDIARNFGMRVIAEGVETAEQLHYLRRLGCHHVQGFYFSRPLPGAEAEALLRNRAWPV